MTVLSVSYPVTTSLPNPTESLLVQVPPGGVVASLVPRGGVIKGLDHICQKGCIDKRRPNHYKIQELQEDLLILYCLLSILCVF